MDTQTASNRTTALLTLFDYQTGFFSKGLDGISEHDMHNRLNTQANHAAWLAGSLVQQRFMMASEISAGLKQTGKIFLKTIREFKRRPSIQR